MLTSLQKTSLGDKSPVDGLAIALNQKVGCLRLRYDFAVEGGATGTYTLRDENGNYPVLPIGAIVTQVFVDIITAVVSTSNDGTFALNLNAAGDLLAAVDADTFPLSAGHPTTGIPTGAAAVMVKATAARQITMAIATHAFTSGKFDVFVYFVLGSTT